MVVGSAGEGDCGFTHCLSCVAGLEVGGRHLNLGWVIRLPFHPKCPKTCARRSHTGPREERGEPFVLPSWVEPATGESSQ